MCEGRLSCIVDDNVSTTGQVMVTTDETSHTSQQLKEMLHQQAPPVIREKLEHYIMSLKNGERAGRGRAKQETQSLHSIEFSQGMLLPNTGSQSTPRGTSPSGMRQPASGRNRTTVSSAGECMCVCAHCGHLTVNPFLQSHL